MSSGPGDLRLPDSGRFIALDSLRGVAALLVVSFHVFDGGVAPNWYFARNGWVFVDFFFVLSGFVIAGAYGEKLAQGFPVLRFMVLRWGRIFPLHLAILGLYVLGETTLLILDPDNMRAAFQGERNLRDFVLTATLTQALIHPTPLGWNAPSWSISVEIWLYAAIAFAWRYGGRAGWLLAVSAAVAAWLLLACGFSGWVTPLNPDLVRGVAGFGLGTACWMIWKRCAHAFLQRLSAPLVSLLEIACVTALIAVLALELSIALADFIFALTLLCFAADRGAAARLLATWPFFWAGVLSYSIYLGHSVVLLVLARLQAALWPSAGIIGETMTGLAVLTGSAGFAWITWRLVEAPARDWSRRLAARMGVGAQERAAPTI
ncbi:acyltransferase [Altererythrobacter sp. SALINAS58]|uniref:acyltransferase family protein n=1 Tax=Alteripontixanthobacter muriae TaxID=2705546 RepID=UPI001576D6AB|nr:acyltransferase [Alteripontixanthobacter muriae]NTZ42264.1 acyltransferase [Alteripontixanthobacter muriae]